MALTQGWVFEPPAGWLATDPPVVALGSSSELTVDFARAWHAADGPARAANVCVGLELPTWTDEATSIALERVSAATAALAIELDPTTPIRVARDARGAVTSEQWFVPQREGPSPADAHEGETVARSVLGFVTDPHSHERLEACVLVCAPAVPSCDDALLRASAHGFTSPPPAAAWLSAVVLGIHHPRGVATSAALLCFLLGVVMVRMRPRRRRK